MKNVKISVVLFVIVVNLHLQAQNFKNIFDKQLKSIYKDYAKIEYQFVDSKILQLDVDDVKISMNEPTVSFIVNVPVKIKYKNQSNYKSEIISIKMQIFDNVVMSSEQINIGDKLTSSNLKIELANVVSFKNNYYKNLDDVIGKLAKVKINENQIITNNMIKQEPIIRYQDKVTAILIVGKVQISFDAIAKNDGELGEMINVQDKRGQIFKGKVIDAKTVIIEK